MCEPDKPGGGERSDGRESGKHERIDILEIISII
jgi:hypothetical protein